MPTKTGIKISVSQKPFPINKLTKIAQIIVYIGNNKYSTANLTEPKNAAFFIFDLIINLEI